jgi:hypothetical protein
MIKKRYSTNLNDKVALRQCVKSGDAGEKGRHYYTRGFTWLESCKKAE